MSAPGRQGPEEATLVAQGEHGSAKHEGAPK